MSQWQLNALGDFSVQQGNETITRFRSDKIRALLAYLAIEADHLHRRESLATLLWPDMTDSVAKRNLRQSLHRLKQTLGATDRWLVVTRQTVTVLGEQLTSDVSRFQTHIHACESHTHRQLHTCTACLEHLEAAAALYQGAFLQELLLEDAGRFEEWQGVLRERLHQQALTALNLLANAYEQKGLHDRALRFARRQIELEPWRESAHRHAMRLLNLSGQREEAFAQFEQCRQVLREKLGVAPTEQTQRLATEIEAGSFSAEMPPPATLQHFPTYLTPFVGRASEIEQIGANMRNPECRLMTLIGGGGIGKTRLSIAAATQLSSEFADGIIFIPFAPVANVDQFLNRIAARLGVLLTDKSPSMEKICQHVAGKQQLWVLDNLEHLRGATPQIIALLTHLPKLKLLVSSREALRIRAEWLFALDGLAYQPQPDGSYSDAETLFWKVARRRRSDLEATPAAEQVVRNVCRWVNGMPLALEMVAAWMRHLSFEEIDEQVGNLDLLVNQYEEAPDRHRSLRTVFESTWQMLTPSAQTALIRLTIFRGGFDKASMAAVAKVSFLDLFALLDNFVVHQSAPNRYAFHTLLWQFVVEKRNTDKGSQDLQGLADAHASYYLTQLAQLGGQLSQQGAGQAAQAIRQAWDNVWHAWHWAVEQKIWVLLRDSAAALVDYAFHQSAVPQCEQALTAAVARVSAETPQTTLTTIILKWQFARILMQISIEQALPHLQAALELCTHATHPVEYRRLLTEWGIALWRIGDSEQAQHVLQDALQLAEHAGDRPQIPYIRHHLANVYGTRDDFEGAKPLYLTAIVEFRIANNLLHCAGVLNDFGTLSTMQLNPSKLGFQLDPTSSSAQKIRDTLPYLLEGFQLYTQLGYQVGICMAAGNLSFAYFLCGEYAQVVALHTKLQAVDYLESNPDILLHVAYAYTKQGRFTEAVAKFRQVWIAANKQTNNISIGACALTGVAYIRIQQNDPLEAAKLLGAVANIARDQDHSRPDKFEKAFLDHCTGLTRAMLNEQEYDLHWSAGANMPPEILSTLILQF